VLSPKRITNNNVDLYYDTRVKNKVKMTLHHNGNIFLDETHTQRLIFCRWFKKEMKIIYGKSYLVDIQ